MPRSSKRKFGRVSKQRRALLRSLSVALIEHSRITTTQAKAKELRPYIEKLVTAGKAPSIAATRRLRSFLPPASVAKLMKEIAPKYAKRGGGYTRIHTMIPRTSDGSRMAIIEFI